MTWLHEPWFRIYLRDQSQAISWGFHTRLTIFDYITHYQIFEIRDISGGAVSGESGRWGLKGVCSESGHTSGINPITSHLCCGDGYKKEQVAKEGCALIYADVCVSLIHCTTCGYWVHGWCSGVWESLARVAQSFVCKVCRAGGKKAADEFALKISC